mgnify:CR=1 FL=1
MLSEKSRPVVEATLPVIAERIPHITPEFYRSMFEARPGARPARRKGRESRGRRDGPATAARPGIALDQGTPAGGVAQ